MFLKAQFFFNFKKGRRSIQFDSLAKDYEKMHDDPKAKYRLYGTYGSALILIILIEINLTRDGNWGIGNNISSCDRIDGWDIVAKKNPYG